MGSLALRGKQRRSFATTSFWPYTYAGWEKLSIFLNLLIQNCSPPKEGDLSKGILETIDMDSYRAEKKAVAIQLADQDVEIQPVPVAGAVIRPSRNSTGSPTSSKISMTN